MKNNKTIRKIINSVIFLIAISCLIKSTYLIYYLNQSFNLRISTNIIMCGIFLIIGSLHKILYTLEDIKNEKKP